MIDTPTTTPPSSHHATGGGNASPLTITPSAQAKIHALLTDESKEAAQKMYLRLAVISGGCSGFQYNFTFDSQITPDDVVLGEPGAQVVVDDVSLGFLQGACIDYKQDLMGAALVVTGNPGAKSSCGCGNSFSVF